MRGRLSEAADLANEIRLRDYAGFPQSPLAEGGVFEPPDDAALGELSTWFRNGHALLESLRPKHHRMSALRVWPHHLDLGALIPLGAGPGRMIGLGLSPGDENYAQPYFYCSPYPVPTADAKRPELRTGHWHAEGFISAIATADELQSGQGHAAVQYMTDAVAACRALVG